MPYQLTEARKTCAAAGLMWDAAAEAEACAAFEALGLTEAQADALMAFHAMRVARLFNPPSYGWRQRLALAAHFLFGRALPPFRKEAR